MANKEHVSVVRQGREAIIAWRAAHPDAQLDLRWADLYGAFLVGADLAGADLEVASLRGAKLAEADLSGVKLGGADLHGAFLPMANLREADLYCAYLGEANLAGADLAGASLHRTELFETAFVDVDLSTVQGLETCYHYGPSTLDRRTLAKSGALPPAFLYGCGLPNWEIVATQLYKPRLTREDAAAIAAEMVHQRCGDTARLHACFLSYSSPDEQFAMQLHDRLQAHGVRCWFAPEHMKVGAYIRDRVERAIRLRETLLLIISEASLTSGWVAHEIAMACEEEHKRQECGDHMPVLFPIVIDSSSEDSGGSWTRPLRRARPIGDFRNWQDNEVFEAAFQLLLVHLRAEASGAAAVAP